MMDYYFGHLTELSISILLLAGVFITVKKMSFSVDVVLPPALTSATIPTGIALILSAYSPEYIAKLADIRFYIAVVGFALILMAISSILKALDDAS